jgi:ADP-heptose:LPS heptosyltransferase
MPEQVARADDLPAFLAAARARRFDLAIQLHGSGQLTNPLMLLLDARLNAGFYTPGRLCPDEERYLPWPTRDAEVRRLLRLVDHLELPSQDEALEFPLRPVDVAELAALPEAADLAPSSYACVHPGARGITRRWPAERFAAVVDGLAARGLRVVLTGSAAETDIVAAVAGLARTAPLSLAGRTTLGALAALLAGARLLVSNDTGLSHLAAALRTPSVIVYSGSDPDRWAPLDRRRHRAVFQPIACRPCGYDFCPIDLQCARRVSPADVLREIDALLNEAWHDAA